MEYKDYIKESSTLFMSALDDIITMFNILSINICMRMSMWHGVCNNIKHNH